MNKLTKLEREVVRATVLKVVRNAPDIAEDALLMEAQWAIQNTTTVEASRRSIMAALRGLRNSDRVLSWWDERGRTRFYAFDDPFALSGVTVQLAGYGRMLFQGVRRMLVRNAETAVWHPVRLLKAYKTDVGSNFDRLLIHCQHPAMSVMLDATYQPIAWALNLDGGVE